MCAPTTHVVALESGPVCARAAALCMLEAIGLHYYYYLPHRVESSARSDGDEGRGSRRG